MVAYCIKLLLIREEPKVIITLRDQLRNANDLYIPPHRVEIVTRLPLCSFPEAWNSAPGNKLNPRQHSYLKELKSIMLSYI
jgi:hypothetical protein